MYEYLFLDRCMYAYLFVGKHECMSPLGMHESPCFIFVHTYVPIYVNRCVCVATNV